MTKLGLQMTNNLHKLLIEQEQKKYAIETGAEIHKKLQQIVIDDTEKGDTDLIKKIKEHKELLSFFNKDSKTEVPIAGYIDNTFISRRIDRLAINDIAKNITVLEYKTDINKQLNHEKYVAQVQEYKKLLQDAYPTYDTECYILWLHDFSLEKCD